VLDHVVEPALVGRPAGSTVSVIDPACGDGRFLAGAKQRIEQAGCIAQLTGIDLDAEAVAAARAELGNGARVISGNGLDREWGSERFDIVLGNPPFLNQLSTATTRGKRSALGGGPYANAAAEFLALAIRLADPAGGRVGLVLPLSIISARDVGPIRAVVESSARMTWCWWAPRPIFEAQVRTCALGFVRGRFGEPAASSKRAVSLYGDADSVLGDHATVTESIEGDAAESPLSVMLPRIERSWGPRFEARPSTAIPVRWGASPGRLNDGTPTLEPVKGATVGPGAEPGSGGDDLPLTASWAWLITDELGIPEVPALQSNGVLGDWAVATADFRDEYYGLVGAVGDDVDGPPLITCGLIDAGVSLWGKQSTRFAKQKYLAPRVDLGVASLAIVAWSEQRLVPKVLVANQTRIIEAVADPRGEWLPSVPVLSVMPSDPAKVWEIAAVLTSAVASAWVAHRGAGAGLSATAIRISPPVLANIPWPIGPLDGALSALRAGDREGCSSLVAEAFGIDGDTSARLNSWWLELLR
jgi:SAM-dependent methyltransferase